MSYFYTATLASSADDGSGIQFSTNALADMIGQVNTSHPAIPVNNGDPRTPPMGRLVMARWDRDHMRVEVELTIPVPMDDKAKWYVVPHCIIRESVVGPNSLRTVTSARLVSAIVTGRPEDKTLEPLHLSEGMTIVKAVPGPVPGPGPGTPFPDMLAAAPSPKPDQLEELPMWVVHYTVPVPGDSLRMSRNSTNVFAEDESHAARNFAAWADRFANAVSITRIVKADNGYQYHPLTDNHFQ